MAHKGISLGSRIVENWPKPIGNQSWEVALRPETAGKTSNPVSGKYSFMFVCFLGPDLNWTQGQILDFSFLGALETISRANFR